MSNLIYTGSDWSYEKIDAVYEQCEIIGREELGLDWYPNVFEIMNFENMLDVYSSVGMPMMYNHWSFGKDFITNYNSYKKGYMGLALEMVINSNPCINYLMDENTMTAQTMVIAHAAIGHNSFFKNNYLYKQWTQADSIIDYLAFAKKYIEKCEEKYGIDEVEYILDAAHSLQKFGVDKYHKPKTYSAKEEENKLKSRDEYYERTRTELWSLVPEKKKGASTTEKVDKFLPRGPEENLLYFLEKTSPILEPWQREILRIVRKIAQYFSPQAQTKTINEGWATTVHYYIMNRLYDKGFIDEGSILEFLHLHSSVIYQPDYDNNRFSGFNPYHLGFSIFSDIKRMSDNPTDEDRDWFPDIAGGDWVENWHYAYENFRDDSFIQQFLSPKVIRDMKLFAYLNPEQAEEYEIINIHNNRGYKNLRKSLANQKAIDIFIPDIQVTSVDFDTRTCYLTHLTDNGILLDEGDMDKTLGYFEMLWGFTVNLTTKDRQTGNILYETD